MNELYEIVKQAAINYGYMDEIRKEASSYNGIMKALTKRVNLASSLAKTNPAKAGFLSNKTWNSFHANSGLYKGRLGEQGFAEAAKMVRGMPSTDPYMKRVYSGMESAFKAGKPNVAGKILSTKAMGKGGGTKWQSVAFGERSFTPYKSMVANKFKNTMPSEFGGLADIARLEGEALSKGMGQTASVFHV